MLDVLLFRCGVADGLLAWLLSLLAVWVLFSTFVIARIFRDPPRLL